MLLPQGQIPGHSELVIITHEAKRPRWLEVLMIKWAESFAKRLAVPASLPIGSEAGSPLSLIPDLTTQWN